MATTLITKETSKSSVNTYYKLELNSITRNQKIITANCKITITLGSGTNLGSGNERTLRVYDSSNTLIDSIIIKSTTDAWAASNTYTYTFSFDYDTGVYTDWSKSGFYIRIVQTSGSTSSCIWDGTSSVSGGNVGNTFSLSAGAAGVIRVKVNGAWKTGVVYVKVSGTWRQGIPYINVDGTWKIGI